MASYLLKGPDADFDRWREAAKGRGLTMAAFLRLAADMAAAKDPGRVSYPAAPTEALSVVVRGERVSVERAETLKPLPGSAKVFRPDPRPVSSKKGRR